MLTDQVDVDGNGKLDFEEFVYAVCGDHGASTRRKLQRAFDMFDVNGSGTIDRWVKRCRERGYLIGPAPTTLLPCSLHLYLPCREELEFMGKKLGAVFTPDEVDKLIKSADTDGDGEIDIHEFSNLLLDSVVA